MKLDRRITNGLAWAGALIVIGVPTADILSAQLFIQPPSTSPADIAVTAPAAVPAVAAPVAVPATEVAVTRQTVVPSVNPPSTDASPVDTFLQSGRKLPSYITGADDAPTAVAAVPEQPARTPAPAPVPSVEPASPVQAVAPATVGPAPVATDPIAVASIPPPRVAPIPMPLSMRPRPAPVAVVQQPGPIVIPPTLTPVPSAQPMPPPAYEVTAADLEDWETGPLSDFLAQRQQGNGGYYAPAQGDYDPNGFFLDQGPNSSGTRVIGRETSPYGFFVN